MSLPTDLTELLDLALKDEGPLLFLTGAGISAASGIPTFRGPEGYWQVGSKNYHPQELATRRNFYRMPDEVWAWYLYRRGVCQAADPNPAHEALARLEQARPDRFLLATQNVDGLHLRAGNSLERTYQIHGNIDFMRCQDGCTTTLFPIPEEMGTEWPKTRKLDDAHRALLRCPECDTRSRPHVLWFDESYNEVHFKFESSLAAANDAALLVIVGTSGATTLPSHIASMAADRNVPFVCVNLDPSPFSTLAERLAYGHFAQGTAEEWVVPICDYLAASS